MYEHFGKVKDTKILRFVHHVDGKETNNKISNLKKVSLEENIKAKKYFYRTDKGDVRRKTRKANPKLP